MRVSYQLLPSELFVDIGIDFCRWDRAVATIPTTGYPLTMAFHSFDQQLVVANETDLVRCVKPYFHRWNSTDGGVKRL